MSSKLHWLVLLVFGCAPNVEVESPSGCATAVHDSEGVAAVAPSAPPVAASSKGHGNAGPQGVDALPPPSVSADVPSATKPVEAAPEGLIHRALPQQKLGFYGVLLPPGYDAPENRSRRYPIVVILHGSGSTEVNHGVLAEIAGREGVIYVLPRAPHPSAEQFREGKEGWSAWPDYPSEWGDYDSPSFPKAEVDKFEIYKHYTRWIADCIADVRKTYRASSDRVVVVGHSQGASFAHLFAAEYPRLVKGYWAFAGSFQWILRLPEAKQQLSALKEARVTSLLVHNDHDPVVDVEQTQSLDAFMTKEGFAHTTRILAGNAHSTTAPVRNLLRAFVREQCCSEKRTGEEPLLGVAGKPLLPAATPVLAFGPGGCDISVHTGADCSSAELGGKVCTLYELEPCAQYSSGYRSTTYQCVGDHWLSTARNKAECGVQRRDPEVPNCSVLAFRTNPTELSSADGCDLALRCGDRDVVVGCDGENDGTGTSLCQCSRAGVKVSLPQSLYAGEAPQSCVTAAQHCAALR